ncbi:Nucleotidylyl transferase, partial [Delitschia confertaspora ATCC 74209]
RFPACYPQVNPVDGYRIHIAQTLSEITGLDATNIYLFVQRSTTLDKGNWLLPVPALKIEGEKPNDIFPESVLLNKSQADGPFICFYFKPAELLKQVIPSVLQNCSKWGNNPLLGLKDPKDSSHRRKRVVIEFSSLNVAKPFHHGHLRSTILGGFLANLYEGSDWDVVRLNYLGDWGKQYGLLALGFKMFGDDKALEEDPIQRLFQIYVRIDQLMGEERKEIQQLEESGEDASKLKNAGLDEQARRYFKAMCDNDPEAIAMWKKFRELSIRKYKSSYARLNIHFDERVSESLMKEASIKAVERKMEAGGLTEESQGATIVDFSKNVPGKVGKAL